MNYSIILIILSIININLACASQRTLKDEIKYEVSPKLELMMLPQELLDKIIRIIMDLDNSPSMQSHIDSIKSYLNIRLINSIFYQLSNNNNLLKQFIGIKNQNPKKIKKTIKNYLYLYKQLKARKEISNRIQTRKTQNSINIESIRCINQEDIKDLKSLDLNIMDHLLKKFHNIKNRELIKKIISFIKKEGININTTDFYGNSGLNNAVRNGYVNLTWALIEAQADLDIRSITQDSLLIIAIENKHLEITKLLLKNNKVDVNFRNNFMNNIPLNVAVKSKNKDILELLLKAPNLEINQLNPNQDYTALMIAAKKLALRIIEMLIQYGADINISNKNGQKAIDIFHQSKNKYVKKKEKLGHLITKNYQKKLDRIEKILTNN